MFASGDGRGGGMRRSRSFSGFNSEHDDLAAANLSRSLTDTSPPPPPPQETSGELDTIFRGVFDANGPLPYSKYQESTSAAAPVPRRRRHHQSRTIDRSPSLEQPRTGLASLLTPIATPSWFSATESSTSSDSVNPSLVRHHKQLQRELRQGDGENFVHPESVLSRRPFYARHQSLQNEPWINRWTDDSSSASASVSASVSGFGYVPSAAAMAIISKSYTSSLTTPSWSNSIESWQSDADSKDARRS